VFSLVKMKNVVGISLSQSLKLNLRAQWLIFRIFLEYKRVLCKYLICEYILFAYFAVFTILFHLNAGHVEFLHTILKYNFVLFIYVFQSKNNLFLT